MNAEPSPKATILFVDDERNILLSLKALFRSRYRVVTANDGESALEILKRESVQVLVSDQRMPGMEGVEVLRRAKAISPATIRLLLTGYSDLKAIVDSINEGEVFRFINKPWDNNALRGIIDLAVGVALDTSHDVAAAPLLAAPATSAEAPSAPLEPANDQEGVYGAGVMVFDQDQEVVAQVRRLVGNVAAVYQVTSIDDAVECLNQHEIGVVVSDVVVNYQDVTAVIKLLKAEHPAIMTIVLTKDLNAEMAIQLINQGQIYRYLRKPISDNWLGLSLRQGFHFYQSHCYAPNLVKRQQVEAIKSEPTGLLGSLVDRFRGLKRRWLSGSGAVARS